VAVIPSNLRFMVPTCMGVWCVAMFLVLALSGSALGLDCASVIAGVALAAPPLTPANPITRFALMCVMCMPIAAAFGLSLTPPVRGLRARLAYISSWGGSKLVRHRPRSLDAPSLVRLIVSTTVLAAGIAVVKAVTPQGSWFLLRWFAGGIAVLAFAEMAMAAMDLATAAAGSILPRLMNSPWRAASVGEFWTRRWNIWTSQKLFRPYCFEPLARYSRVLALFVTFGLSGIAHLLLAFMAMGDWTLSLMCGAFFVVQPLPILAEHWLKVRRWPRAAGHAWTLTVLAITSPLLVEPVLRMAERSWGTPDDVLVPTAVALGFVLFWSIFFVVALRPPGEKEVYANRTN
jgi:hypothetical protein